MMCDLNGYKNINSYHENCHVFKIFEFTSDSKSPFHRTDTTKHVTVTVMKGNMSLIMIHLKDIVFAGAIHASITKVKKLFLL